MEAAERLLRTQSPVTLTAVSIAKEAKMSSAAFYLYFEDVRNVLLALSEAAATEMVEAHQILQQPWDAKEPDFRHAFDLVSAFYRVYERHSSVLRYCNLEADRGDVRFEQVRLSIVVPFFEQVAERIYAASAKDARRSRGDAYAEAIVLVSAMERSASSDPKKVQSTIGTKRLQEATARLIAWCLSPSAAHSMSLGTADPPAKPAKPGPAKATRKKAKAVRAG
jgi:AcrR family transcriptional regulator